MKKLVLSAIVMATVVSCKKVVEGGNQGVLRMEDGIERYDTHDTRGHGDAQHTQKNKVEVEVNGSKLNAFAHGLEENIVKFLAEGSYEKATDDSALKNIWFDFDNVNFEMGSSNKLIQGSEEQLKNLSIILKAYPDTKIKVGGYTDKTGDEAVNKKISQERAEFIRAELSKLGVGNQIVSAEGYGSDFAKVSAEATDEERASDRKMAVRFTK